MARYLLELSLLEAECVCFIPVQLAAAALRLARHLIQEPHTPESEAAWCIASTIYLGRYLGTLISAHFNCYSTILNINLKLLNK